MSVDVESLAKSWIALSHASEGSREHEELFWAHGALWNMCLENPDRAWEVILAVLAKDPDPRVFADLAAGPLEDLLVHHGSAVIQRVEERAKVDRGFSALLGGVWKNNIKHDVWERVEAARSHKW